MLYVFGSICSCSFTHSLMTTRLTHSTAAISIALTRLVGILLATQVTHRALSGSSRASAPSR